MSATHFQMGWMGGQRTSRYSKMLTFTESRSRSLVVVVQFFVFFCVLENLHNKNVKGVKTYGLSVVR